MNMQFVKKDTLSGLQSSYKNYVASAQEKLVNAEPRGKKSKVPKKQLLQWKKGVLSHAKELGAVKIAVLLAKHGKISDKAIVNVQARFDSMLFKGKVKFIENLYSLCKKGVLEKSFAFNLLSKLDPGQNQKVIKFLASKFSLNEVGLVTKDQLRTFDKKKKDITYKDFVKIALHYELPHLFHDSIAAIKGEDLAELLDSEQNLGIRKEWCLKALESMDIEKDMMCVKLLLKELGVLKDDILDEKQLQSVGEDITIMQLMKIAVNYDLPKLFLKSIKLYEDKDATLEQIEDTILATVQMALDAKSFNVVMAFLPIMIEADDFDGYEMFDNHVTELRANNLTVNDQNQNILHLIVQTGNLPLLQHYKEKFLCDVTSQHIAVCARDINGLTALHYAATMSDGIFMRELLAFDGAKYSLNIRSKVEGSHTPLGTAFKDSTFTKEGPLYAIVEAASNNPEMLSHSNLEVLEECLLEVGGAEESDVMQKLNEILYPPKKEEPILDILDSLLDGLSDDNMSQQTHNSMESDLVHHKALSRCKAYAKLPEPAPDDDQVSVTSDDNAMMGEVISTHSIGSDG